MKKFRTAAVAVTGALALTTSLSGLAAPQAQAAGSADYASVVKADNPSHYWRFEQAAGQPTPDEVGGVQIPGVRAVDGLDSLGHAAKDLHAQLDTPGEEQWTAWTYEAWVRTTDATRAASIFGASDGWGFGGAWSDNANLELTESGEVALHYGDDLQLLYGGVVNDGQWHHVVGTGSKDDGVKLYVDGVLRGSNPGFAPFNTDDTQMITGCESASGYGLYPEEHCLTGEVDELAAYDHVLTAQQVAAHYAAATGKVVTPVDATGNQAPTPDFTSSCAASGDGLLCHLDGSPSTDPDGSVTAWHWEINDGRNQITYLTGRNPEWRIPAADRYRVKLTVTDDKGATVTGPSRIVDAVAPEPPAPTAPVPGRTYDQVVSGDAPAHHWRFEEPAGSSTVADSAPVGKRDNGDGSVNPGVPVPVALHLSSGVTLGATSVPSGALGAALHLDGGSSARAVSADDETMPTWGFAYETWVRTTSTTGGALVTAKDGTQGLSLDAQGHVVFASESGFPTVTSSVRVNDGQWHHVVGSFGWDTVLTIHVDGQRVALDATRYDSDAPGTSSAFVVGCHEGASPCLEADVDEVAVYRTSLTSTQVVQHWLQGTQAAGTSPSPTPSVTPTPEPTATPSTQPSTAPAPSTTPAPSSVPKPSKTPKAPKAPKPSKTPKAPKTPKPVKAPRPSATSTPTATPTRHS